MATTAKTYWWGDEDDDDRKPSSSCARTVLNEDSNEDKHGARTQKKVTNVTKRVLERKMWTKFGAALNDVNVTHVSHVEVTLEDPNDDPGPKREPDIGRHDIATVIIVCRHCGITGDHWTLKCPYKDTPINENTATGGDPPSTTSSLLPTNTDTYVPPGLRGRTGLRSGGADGSQGDRDSTTLRVTNISPDTREDDLKDLFRAFGTITHVYLPKDRETFVSRGFAFVSFMYREDAERAMNKLQGYGYDHLILKIEWAKPSNKPAGESQDPGSMSTTFRSGYGKALPQNVAPSQPK